VDGDTRDQNGRFKAGHPGGPGRPRRCIEADYLAVLSAAVPLETWRQIAEAAAQAAAGGDHRAREWLSAYLLPRPDGEMLLRLAGAELAGADPIAAQAEHAWIANLFAEQFAKRQGLDSTEALTRHQAVQTVVRALGSG
jgi:hypothetical protein